MWTDRPEVTPEDAVRIHETRNGAQEPGASTGLEYLDAYIAAIRHQAQCDDFSRRGLTLLGRSGIPEPSRVCYGRPCRSSAESDSVHGLCQRYAWAVPNVAALDAIRDHSPGGVVEIGAGGGYWAMELQRRGVDVLPFDPDPPGLSAEGNGWHHGYAWTAVHEGDHTHAGLHPERTLFLCWPSYDDRWAAEAVQLYHAAGGRTVIYVGEGQGGCTGDDLLHTLLNGERPYCWHGGDEDPCARCRTANAATQLYLPKLDLAIPRWSGIHDRLHVYERAT